jgi:molybdopterin molybdotransferase
MNSMPYLKNPSWYQARQVAYDSAPHKLIEEIDLKFAVGRTLAQDIKTLHPLPPFNTCMMDGYAVRGDGPWKIVGQVLAGQNKTEIEAGEALAIATGAPAPDSADFVIKHEDVDIINDNVVLKKAIQLNPRQHIRPIGDEGAENELIISAGTRINPAALGLAASCGWDKLKVFQVPVVDFIVSGDELLAEGLPKDGKIRDSLSMQIPSWIQAVDAAVGKSNRVKDELAETVSTINKCQADLILTTGGTAAGNVDFIHQALKQCGFELMIDAVAVRPGHPMFLAKNTKGQFLVGLPGNPLAAMVGFVTLAQPIVEKLLGRSLTQLTKAKLVASAHTSKNEMRLFPVSVKNNQVSPQAYWGSMMLRGLAASTHFAIIEANKGKAGDEVALLPVPWKT